MDYIKIKVSQLEVGNDIVWRGRVCRVVQKRGGIGVRVREFKNKGVAKQDFKDRWHTIYEDLEVDRVIT